MKYTKIAYEQEARQKLFEGARKLSKAVVSTLGPRSKNVAINQEYPSPLIVHDGVTVARSIRLEDEFEDMGATLLREASSKTNDVAGDGTTTATLLAWTLLEQGSKLVSGGIMDKVITKRVNAMYLREQLIKRSTEIVERLKEHVVEVKDYEQYKKVATVSSQDEHIGKLVADAIQKVGKSGVVMVEEGNTFNDTLEIKEGMEFENGYLSHYFVTDAHRMIAELKDCYVLMTDYSIQDPFDLVPIIEKIKADGARGLLIIANDVVGSALQTLVLTKLKIGFPVVAVVAPEFAERRRQMLEDIAILTGGECILHDTGTLLKDVKLSQLGRAKSVRVTQTHTMILPENPDSDEIKDRVGAIKELIDAEKNEFKKQRLEYRLSKLAGGMAVIYAGGSSASEVNERRERIIDAVHATRAALEEGVIAGGGTTLFAIAQNLRIPEGSKSIINEDDALIESIIVETLEKPFKQILINAGFDEDKHADQMRNQKENHGFNVLTGKFVDMIEEGIVDPVKVTRLAVIHAFSVAAMLLTTDTIISEPRDKEDK